MNLRRLLPMILCAAPAFAIDEYQPAEEGVIAVDLRSGFTQGLGDYDTEGRIIDPVGSPFTWSPGVQVRLGLPNVTEISLQVPLSVMNKDALRADEGDWGFQQPVLGFKLGHEDYKVAVVGAVAFPMGHKVVVGDESRWKFSVGGLAHWDRKAFLVDATVLWTATPADQDGVRRGDEWLLLARPQWRVDSTFTPYLGLVGQVRTAGKVNEIRVGQMSHLVSVQPGTFITFNEEWSAEFQIPVTIAGDWPQSASAGVYAGVTLNMGP
ncbi:MAG: hypothetical protein H6686_12125 [Fibrobacteria bacterium]|nr:hypothetical protein [Fibrobacteria bacterium]